MAVAGLHSASVLDSSFLRETQASSILQIWPELEGEHDVNPRRAGFRDGSQQQSSDGLGAVFAGTCLTPREGNGTDDANEVENQTESWFPDSHSENADSNSSCSEQFTDLGRVERERVRQIFQDWTNTGVRGQGSNISRMNNCSREQWLGENEQGRVRIIREWAQMTSQQIGSTGGRREEQAAGIGAQIEQVRDGLLVNHCEIGGRRPIRKLCGRQALLDLLVRAAIERQRELQLLSDYRSVSDFPHRNRIQALLKGRFLRNERAVQDERPTSTAANELGLLRQRHTVSGLREGFLTGLDSFVRGSASGTHSDVSSNIDSNPSREEEIHIISSQGGNEPSNPCNGESEISGFTSHDLQGNAREDTSQQESLAQVREWQEESLEDEERVEQLAHNIQLFENRCIMGERGTLQVSTTNGWSQENSGVESEDHVHQPEALETVQELHETSSNQSDARGSLEVTDNYEGSSVESINLLDTSAHVDGWQESFTDNEETDWRLLNDVGVGEQSNDTGEGMDSNWTEAPVNHWYGTSEVETEEPDEEWHENGVQGDMNNWLEGPSSLGAAPVGNVTSFYFPEDDNDHSGELRELLSRRSVSNLLQSGFRENLDRLIRSYVERQAHASGVWEDDETLPFPAMEEQDLEPLQTGDQNEGHTDAIERTPVFLPPASLTSSLPLWDQELHDPNWSPLNSHHHSGTEWDVINDLRIDMARLQQRMNSMQRLLEACMDMQLELQRAVRQEVSAALNRSAGSTEEDDSLSIDESKWDNVRKGVCCICSESRIDSLLYRCGHMCTCSKCADKLVHGSGKCPMCHAPVVEMVRAYSIQ